jgi:hypothetical protein
MSTPEILAIFPGSGTTKGGTTVTIIGSNLSNVTAVTIGANNATNLTIESSTQITCTTPAGDVGTDDVVAIADNYGSTWTQTSAPIGAWWPIAMSSNGQIQTAAIFGGSIYTSDDYGASWSIQTSGSGLPASATWTGVAMSSDGTIQTAVVIGGGIYQSSDSGQTWTQNTFGGLPAFAGWYGIAMSSNGTIQTACIALGSGSASGIYQSSTSGTTWTQSAPSAYWISVAMSSDGTIQTAVVNGGGIYQLTTYGTWGQNMSAPSADWLSVAMSSDGTIQTAVVNGGGIYQLTTSGTWTPYTSAPSADWQSVAMSSDGTIQTAITYTGPNLGSIYILTNSGTTWSQNMSAPSAGWYSLAMSSDGTIQSAVDNGGSIWTANPISSNSLDYTYEKIVISNICFPAGTPVTTDQGNIPIDKINPEIHTIHNNPIVAITKTITQDTHLVCFEKHALGLNKPNKKTVTSKNHKVYYNGKMTKAHHFLKQFKNVTEIEYNGEILYNVLMEKHDKLKVNNLTFETLDPKNIIAKLCTSNFDKEYKDNIIVMINNSIMQNDHRLYQNIINRVVNDKSLSTCFDEEPEYEYEEPEYEEPVNTTRIDTLRNSAEKSLPNQAINFNVKLNFDNVPLHSKLTKYIKAQQNKDTQEAEVVQEEVIDFKVKKVNMDNNVNLHSKLNKYAKIYQNKDDIDEIIKKKEFINLKKEEKEERERQEENEERVRKESKMKASLAVVEKSKTYKRVQLFKRNGTSKRLF